jgi:hypothetical protein
MQECLLLNSTHTGSTNNQPLVHVPAQPAANSNQTLLHAQ